MGLDIIYYAINDLMVFEELFAGPFTYEIPDEYLFAHIPLNNSKSTSLKISLNLAEDI